MVDLSGTGQGLGSRNTSVDLSVEPAEYFGAPIHQLQNADIFGLRPHPQKDLYRVQYLYLMVFGNSESASGYGGIQVRASTYLYLEDGRVNTNMQRVIQRIAHRGAFLFDSSLQHPIYGGGGGNWSDGGGYLSGFNPVEMNNDAYRNWEVEPVGSDLGKPAGAQPGKIDWTTEIYLEVEGTEYADLSGVGQGVGNPYNLKRHEIPPEPPVQAQQEWWEVTFNSAKNSYDLHPPGYSASKERSQNLAGKDVYLNGLFIGTITVDGRVWLKKEYKTASGMTWGDRHSKKSVVDKTPALGQSIRGTNENPGKIAKVDESPKAVYMATKQARKDFDPVDPDEVDPDRQIVEGQRGDTVLLLTLADPEDATIQECRQDEEKIRHMGYSEPRYAHMFSETWQWPGFRPIAEFGAILRPDDYRDDDQTGVDEFEGDQ